MIGESMIRCRSAQVSAGGFVTASGGAKNRGFGWIGAGAT
jgi:hypothetical protein